MRETLIDGQKTAAFASPPPTLPDPNPLERGRWLESRTAPFSIEVCPNRPLDVKMLADIAPGMCSVTWHAQGAEGGTAAIGLAVELRRRGQETLLHLAGRNLKKEEVVEILEGVKRCGVRNLLALQGDPSSVLEKDDVKCDFPYASNLVQFIREKYGHFFVIGVAGYPEKHPQSENPKQDIEYLRRKVECGADFIITQACYTFATIASFAKKCRSNGIRVPIIPGVFIFSTRRALRAMSDSCGVPIPEDVLDVVERNKEDDTIREFGIHRAAQLMKSILAGGGDFGGFHVFTLNDLELLAEVLGRLGLYGVRIERPLSNFNKKLVCTQLIHYKKRRFLKHYPRIQKPTNL